MARSEILKTGFLENDCRSESRALNQSTFVPARVTKILQRGQVF